MGKKEQTPGQFTDSIRAESMPRALWSISLPPCGCNCSFRQRSKRCRGRERCNNLLVPRLGWCIPLKIWTEGKKECAQVRVWGKTVLKENVREWKGSTLPSSWRNCFLNRVFLAITRPRAVAGPRGPTAVTAPSHLQLCINPQAAVDGGKT